MLLLFVWFCFAGMAALTIDMRLFPCVAGYLLAFAVAASRPDLALYAMSASNLAMTLNAVVIWRPTTWSYTDVERAELGKPPRKRGRTARE